MCRIVCFSMVNAVLVIRFLIIYPTIFNEYIVLLFYLILCTILNFVVSIFHVSVHKNFDISHTETLIIYKQSFHIIIYKTLLNNK